MRTLLVRIRCFLGEEERRFFRRVNGHLHLQTLRDALEQDTAETVRRTCHDETVTAA